MAHPPNRPRPQLRRRRPVWRQRRRRRRRQALKARPRRACPQTLPMASLSQLLEALPAHFAGVAPSREAAKQAYMQALQLCAATRSQGGRRDARLEQ